MDQEINNALNESIDDFKKAQDDIKEVIKNSDKVKSGESTLEDELKEPGYILYNNITEVCISILNDEQVKKRFVELGSSLGLTTVKTLVELIAVIMTQSSYQTILMYDNMLKKEISEQFSRYGNNLNILKSSTDAHESVLRVFKEKISKLESTNAVEKFSKENNIHNE
jgi:hypothetical protein